MRSECIAMLLAGGRGERLKSLTERLAKPAVTFGGKYKIIDFTLTNCVNSGINTVGVLTQYRPLRLNSYIGKGQYWDLDLMSGGVDILPPYSTGSSAAWYSGSSNAIFQNQHYIESFDPEYVLILSGDQIYKMDYSKMIETHKANGADATIAVIEVSYEEASRFGIMSTDSDGRVTEFEEKPAAPKSNLASMGIYVFRWDVLKKQLIQDESDEESVHDFGKNIIPTMLKQGKKMFAYRYEGYWRDVGTTDSLWQANMDFLEDMTLGLADWLIFSRAIGKPPQYIAPCGSVKNSLVTEGCEIYGSVEHSILSESVIVEEGAVVRDCVIMANTRVKKGAVVQYAILDENVTVEEGIAVGTPREEDGSLTVIGRDVVLDTKSVHLSAV